MTKKDLGRKKMKYIRITERSHIRIELVPLDASAPAAAEMKPAAEGVSVATEDCLSIKDCLTVFGDGTAASFKLRNINELQLACLQHSSGATHLSSDLADKCEEWLNCLDSDKKSSLEALLLAAGVGASGKSLSAVARANESTVAAARRCTDPATEDPESWDCDCLERMKEQCGGVDEACFREIMCNHEMICQSWKEDNCPDAAVEVSSAEWIQQRQASDVREGENSLDDSLR